MTSKQSRNSYRLLYARLLRLYPKPYYDRFGEGMEQTFQDVCRERAEAPALPFIFWIFLETFTEIIKEHMHSAFAKNKNIFLIVIATALILLIPLIAMQFSNDVVWTLSDFVFAATLLLSAGIGFELISRKVKTSAYKIAVGLAIGAAFLLVWINGAVGIIGSEDNPANMLYAGVLLVGFVGAIIARLQPRAMSVALFAVAIAQALVPIVALIIWQPSFSMGVIKVFILNGFFVALFAASALLFRRASAVTKR